jgi:hypothetical protein
MIQKSGVSSGNMSSWPYKRSKNERFMPKLLASGHTRGVSFHKEYILENLLSTSKCGPSRGVASHEDGLLKQGPLYSMYMGH